MWRHLIFGLISVLCLTCKHQDLNKDALANYKLISKVDFAGFKWCNITQRQGENVYVYDYLENDSTHRFVFKVDSGNYFIRPIFPTTDKKFSPLALYDENEMKSLMVNKKTEKKNLDIFFRYKLQHVIYNKDIDGVIITVNGYTFINLLSTLKSEHIPMAYKKIDSLWFYYSERSPQQKISGEDSIGKSMKHKGEKAKVDNSTLLLGVWGASGEGNASFYIRKDSIYYEDDNRYYKYAIKVDSIKIFYDEAAESFCYKFSGDDTLTLTGQDGPFKFYRRKK